MLLRVDKYAAGATRSGAGYVYCLCRCARHSPWVAIQPARSSVRRRSRKWRGLHHNFRSMSAGTISGRALFGGIHQPHLQVRLAGEQDYGCGESAFEQYWRASPKSRRENQTGKLVVRRIQTLELLGSWAAQIPLLSSCCCNRRDSRHSIH
jgi:hypothetical protein